jgi:uncharacterized protein YneF (UPF0154 family)
MNIYKQLSKREWIILVLAIIVGFVGGYFTATIVLLSGMK